MTRFDAISLLIMAFAVGLAIGACERDAAPPPAIATQTTLTVFPTASAVSVTATMPEHTTEHDLAERLAFLLREKGVDAKADGADVVLPMGWEKR